LFLRILFTQNSRFVFGILQQSEFSIISSILHLPSDICGNATLCPCQKHPFTKIQVLYFLSTKSGCPGNRLWFSLYLNPLRHNPRRTIISGFVSFDLIAAILADRRACSRSAEQMQASLCSPLIAALACRCCIESFSI
jgi:hypothetical protein